MKVYELASFLASSTSSAGSRSWPRPPTTIPTSTSATASCASRCSTHDSGGLTAADLSLAGEIEGAARDPRRRRRGVILFLCVALVVAVIRDPGPQPDDVAMAYELAWDHLDFESLWTLSGRELHDGLDRTVVRRRRSGPRTRSRPELGRLARDVTLDDAVTAARTTRSSARGRAA